VWVSYLVASFIVSCVVMNNQILVFLINLLENLHQKLRIKTGEKHPNKTEKNLLQNVFFKSYFLNNMGYQWHC
jgi:hypothetical protein